MLPDIANCNISIHEDLLERRRATPKARKPRKPLRTLHRTKLEIAQCKAHVGQLCTAQILPSGRSPSFPKAASKPASTNRFGQCLSAQEMVGKQVDAELYKLPDGQLRASHVRAVQGQQEKLGDEEPPLFARKDGDEDSIGSKFCLGASEGFCVT